MKERDTSNFTLYNLETAKPLLEKSIKGFGMLPNLHAMMAQSPALLDAHQSYTNCRKMRPSIKMS